MFPVPEKGCITLETIPYLLICNLLILLCCHNFYSTVDESHINVKSKKYFEGHDACLKMLFADGADMNIRTKFMYRECVRLGMFGTDVSVSTNGQ